MSEVKNKPHYFELSLRSVSNGVLNQECPLVREYADTPGELTMKQMMFTKEAAAKIAQVVIDAMDTMSMPYQELGVAELASQMEELARGKGQRQARGDTVQGGPRPGDR